MASPATLVVEVTSCCECDCNSGDGCGASGSGGIRGGDCTGIMRANGRSCRRHRRIKIKRFKIRLSTQSSAEPKTLKSCTGPSVCRLPTERS